MPRRRRRVGTATGIGSFSYRLSSPGVAADHFPFPALARWKHMCDRGDNSRRWALAPANVRELVRPMPPRLPRQQPARIAPAVAPPTPRQHLRGVTRKRAKSRKLVRAVFARRGHHSLTLPSGIGRDYDALPAPPMRSKRNPAPIPSLSRHLRRPRRSTAPFKSRPAQHPLEPRKGPTVHHPPHHTATLSLLAWRSPSLSRVRSTRLPSPSIHPPASPAQRHRRSSRSPN